MEGEDVPGKLFLGGLAQETTTQSIQAYFGQFGDITDAVAMRGKDGRNRGFGFVTYADPLTAQLVLEQPHELDGRAVDVKACSFAGTAGVPAALAGKGQDLGEEAPEPPWQRPRQRHSQQDAKPGAESKIFVGGIGDCSDAEFRSYFQAYGELVDCVVMKEKESGRPRGFGFIQYDEQAAAELVIQDADNHVIGGRKVEVKRCVPKEQIAQPQFEPPAWSPPAWHAPVHSPPAWHAPVHSPPPWHAPVQPSMPQPGHGANKLFVGGIGTMTTLELQSYFGQYGNLLDAVAMINKGTGEPRGFGFVTFDNADSVAAVLRDYAHHQLNGKWMEVKLADGAGGMAMEASAPPTRAPPMRYPPIQQAPGRRAPMTAGHFYAAGMPTESPRNGASASSSELKVFVGGLAKDVEDELFKMYWQQFGNITDHVVMRNKETGEPRGFGFVTFEDPFVVDAVMNAAEEHQINGKRVEVKRCVPKEQMGAASFEPAPAMPRMPRGMSALGALEHAVHEVLAPSRPTRVASPAVPRPAPARATAESSKLFVGGIGAKLA